MSRSLPPSPGPTSVRQESEASAAIISGFVAWLLLQALLTATEMLADSAPGPVARAVLLSVLIVSFQTQRFHAYGARYWFPASVGAFELLRSPMSGAGPVTFLFVALWMAMPWLLCSLKLEGRLRTLERVYPLLHHSVLELTRVDHLQPRVQGWVCRRAARTLERLRRWCALALNHERSRSRVLRLMALDPVQRRPNALFISRRALTKCGWY